MSTPLERPISLDAQPQPARRELAQRTASGLEITLFWSAGANTLTVRVADRVAQSCFEMAVSPARGTFAFHHPFAYAVEQGLPLLPTAAPAA